jgi:hypothetical protein
MKIIIKAISFGALLAAGNLAFAGEPMVLGANDLDSVSAGAYYYQPTSSAGGQAQGVNASVVAVSTNSSSHTYTNTFFGPVLTGATVYSTSVATASANNGGNYFAPVSASAGGYAGFTTLP